jgi:hypothetical protein
MSLAAAGLAEGVASFGREDCATVLRELIPGRTQQAVDTQIRRIKSPVIFWRITMV